MADRIAGICARERILNEIRQGIFDKIVDEGVETKDEQIAYLLGVVDTLLKRG